MVKMMKQFMQLRNIFGVLKYATLEVNFRREREGKITWKRWSGK